MLKKIAMGALLTGLVAVLILGAVTRTNAVSGEGAGETGRRGRTTAVAAANEATGRGGRWAEGVVAAQAQAGQESTPSGIPQAEVQPAEWRIVEGTVVSVADDLVEIRTAAGEVIPFEGRPLSYALEQGFGAQVGDAVALDGFDEDGEFKLGQVTSNGMTVTLRDADDRPGWAGRGRQW